MALETGLRDLAAVESTAAPGRAASLLLVDDDASAIRVMSQMLSEYPRQRFATSGADALRLAREQTPDLIMLDADMPGMSGLELCDALKADPVLAQVPVIFVTSHDTPALELSALERGAADFVSKPLVAEQLAARVRAQLRSGLQSAELRRERIAAGAEPSPTSKQPPRLLIVDDDVAAIRILRHTLANMGDFHFARDGAEALRLARQLQPDLILLDAHMPQLDGFQVCAALKANPQFKHVPIVFVTRFSDPGSEMRALDLGATDFIAKPYSPAVLHARVRNLIELKRHSDAELQAVHDHWRHVGDARVNDIVDSVFDAIIAHDAAGRVVLINAAACRMFGVLSAEVMGGPVRALLGDAPRQPGQAQLATVSTRSGPLCVEMSVSETGEAAQRLGTVVLRDISERQRLEAESRARIEAETANRTKTLMLAYLAHEMGNPLNGMLGFAQLMADDAALAPGHARQLERITGCGMQLRGLMHDLLDIGRLETGHLSLKPGTHDAAICAAAALEAVAPLASQAGVDLNYRQSSAAGPIRLVADAERLHQCLVNLLSNAIKYNHPGGRVDLLLHSNEGRAALSVQDNGLGMDVQQLEHLFEPFNRLGRDHSGVPGSGLGLMITRQLIEAMQGDLQVESAVGAGSCFTLHLPLASGVEAEPAPVQP